MTHYTVSVLENYDLNLLESIRKLKKLQTLTCPPILHLKFQVMRWITDKEEMFANHLKLWCHRDQIHHPVR